MLELGPRIINPRREYTRLVAGIRGALGSEWEMDAWLTWLREQLAAQRARVAIGQSRRPAIQSDGMKYHSVTA